MRKNDFIAYYNNMDSIGDIDPFIWMSNYIADRLELNENQIIYFCFLQSITYQLPSAYLIINEFPDLELIGEEKLRKWWDEIQQFVPFQTDKMKQRKYLPDTLISYKNLIRAKGNHFYQKTYFDELLSKTPEENFDILYNEFHKNIKHFGRFSTWNFAQSLKTISGYDIKPSTLLLGTSEGESHTYGLCYAFGKDDWVAKRVNGKKIKHKFTKEELQKLEEDTLSLGFDDAFKIETVACAFKKLFRQNDSRYLGYYLDRQAEDIKKLEQVSQFSGVDWQILWDARKELIDKKYLHGKIDKTKFKWHYKDKIKKINAISDF